MNEFEGEKIAKAHPGRTFVTSGICYGFFEPNKPPEEPDDDEEPEEPKVLVAV